MGPSPHSESSKPPADSAPSSGKGARQIQITVVGIDCATDPAKVGLALGTFTGQRTSVEQVRLGSKRETPAAIVVDWLRERQAPALLALDAPLGWPAPLATALAQHYAGEELLPAAHALFRRTTDRFVKQRLGKQSLDVGADRIARTAYAALALLGELRHRLEVAIPLAWQPTVSGLSAIEVYPAATLAAHGILARGYKQVAGREVREQILQALAGRLEMRSAVSSTLESEHAIDAVVCLLAAQDFLAGQSSPPEDRKLADQEGWIWIPHRAGSAAPSADGTAPCELDR